VTASAVFLKKLVMYIPVQSSPLAYFGQVFNIAISIFNIQVAVDSTSALMDALASPLVGNDSPVLCEILSQAHILPSFFLFKFILFNLVRQAMPITVSGRDFDATSDAIDEG
jgi:hypothetical protein